MYTSTFLEDNYSANMGITLEELNAIYGPYRCTCPGPQPAQVGEETIRCDTPVKEKR